ncbi:hypothetical protein [Helicobacter zhangjianzhongii]|uniref:Uncharacterized protein n=1 Tax=Helicobacter zhangjianzhongii TaxID=2974574 RepID=A0ACC6FS80_9HELI|nr:hypothetical protein [Helicobacter sp. CPD2-1]MDL0079771.1 hypothetical protein [Helicobacter sp. CPD2-1]MDL0082134.1 hypothetical protein [Helicobacter sp. XJK30-2]
MRIDYGLSTTSLSSLLHTTKDLDTTPQESSSTQTTKEPAPVSKTLPPKAPLESTQADTPTQRETFGLEILEKMSDKEYQVFLRASEGMSEVEKMAAAQTLYIFTESYAKDSTQATKPHPSTPPMKKNPYFSAREQFLTRYVALYNGAQEVNIIG